MFVFEEFFMDIDFGDIFGLDFLEDVQVEEVFGEVELEEVLQED